MILSGKTIREAVQDGWIGVEPEPTDEQFQPASLDITLGSQVYDVQMDSNHEVDEEILLRPGGRYLGHTAEKIDLPNDVAAQVAGRSSLGRMFVTVHQTAGWIDPGFKGQITLELANFSHNAHRIKVGERVGQFIFFLLDKSAEPYDGRYQGDTGAQPSEGL